jgi:hypothetical protein
LIPDVFGSKYTNIAKKGNLIDVLIPDVFGRGILFRGCCLLAAKDIRNQHIYQYLV